MVKHRLWRRSNVCGVRLRETRPAQPGINITIPFPPRAVLAVWATVQRQVEMVVRGLDTPRAEPRMLAPAQSSLCRVDASASLRMCVLYMCHALLARCEACRSYYRAYHLQKGPTQGFGGSLVCTSTQQVFTFLLVQHLRGQRTASPAMRTVVCASGKCFIAA